MNKQIFNEAFDSLPEVVRQSRPQNVLILGSGWSQAIDGIDVIAEVPYGDIRHFGDATVIGHAGRLVLLRLPSGDDALAFCGRRHWYEGAGWEAIVMPVVLGQRLGADTLLITNASGGIRPDLAAGDIVILRDHIRFNHLNPLRGPHDPDFGPRFPDQSNVYDLNLQKRLREAGKAMGMKLTTGVYVFSAGPVYETPAEIRAYGILGADLVGMSTVPEAMFANACGMRVAALSFVSNMASGISDHALSGTDVIECAKANAPKMAALVRGFLAKTVDDQDAGARVEFQP